MCRLLDPHSGVVTGEELRRGSGVDQQSGVGVELVDNLGVGPVRIKRVVPGSPAQAGGLRPGDVIASVDDTPLKDVPAQWVDDCLRDGTDLETIRRVSVITIRGKKSEPVTLTVERPGWKEPRKVKLQRGDFQPETVLGIRRREDNSWDYLFDRKNKVGLIRLGGLGNTTAYDTRQALERLKRAEMRGLVLDLRWCPGGYLREAANTAAQFLGDAPLATIKTREREQKLTSEAGDNKFTDFPLAVLVNGETSGGAELIAAALQDNKRAVVVGQRTVGKASLQTVLPLNVNGCGLKLTTGTFVRPSGANLNRERDSRPGDDWGVRPDPGLDERTSPDLARRLGEWWQQQTLRPGTSAEALPLDDPEADPQLVAAVRAVLAKLK
jgi:carboxyl-terminal processing protease